MDNLTISRYNAFIGLRQTFWNYLANYKNAFDVLLKDVERTNRNVDYIAYPLLFIARHCMELGFKCNIRYFMKYSEKDDYSKASTHNLEDLLTGFQIHINATIKNLKDKHNLTVEDVDINEFQKYLNKVKSLNVTLHKLDKNSDSFRYPVDKKNNLSFENEKEQINLLEVNELFEDSMTLFSYTADMFAKYTDLVDEMERLYEEQMQELYNENYF